MKNLIIWLTLILLLFAACYQNPDRPQQEPNIMPGAVAFTLNSNAQFVNAAYCLTDTLRLVISTAQGIDYQLDTPFAVVLLDSIIKSKPYFAEDYTIVTIGTKAQTRDLIFQSFTKNDVVDWDTTMQIFQIEEKLTYNPQGIVYVPQGQEQQYIDSLKKRSWFFSSATYVYAP